MEDVFLKVQFQHSDGEGQGHKTEKREGMKSRTRR